MKTDDLLKATQNPDWMQVVYNQGPPCFHIEDGRFCFRAQRWDGHRKSDPNDILIHAYVSPEQFTRSIQADALRHAATFINVDGNPELALRKILAEANKLEDK